MRKLSIPTPINKELNMKQEQTELLLKRVMSEETFVYRGCIVSRWIGGFVVHNIKCKNMDEVDEAINQGLKSIENSIK